MKNKGGRPTVVDKDVIKVLEQAFSMGCTDKEACVLADISHQTLYNYQKDHPEFVERKEQLKEKPILKARKTVVDSLDNDVDSAWKYLERKDPELNPKSVIDHTSKGEKINDVSQANISEIAKGVAEQLKEKKLKE